MGISDKINFEIKENEDGSIHVEASFLIRECRIIDEREFLTYQVGDDNSLKNLKIENAKAECKRVIITRIEKELENTFEETIFNDPFGEGE